jgi:hypothetical protein
MMDKSKGIVYVAINKKWIKEVDYSASSVKKKCPDLPITLFTDKKIKSKYIDDCIVDSGISGTRFKFNYIDKTPYYYTLFLDSDTMVRTNIAFDFDVLDKFDIALTLCICRVSESYKSLIADYKNIPDSFSPFQGGFILYKKTEKVMNFIKLWRTLYYKYLKRYKVIQDQPSLRVALWNSDLRIHTLPLEYNLKDIHRLNKFYKRINPKIIHDHKLFNRNEQYISKNFRLI